MRRLSLQRWQHPGLWTLALFAGLAVAPPAAAQTSVVGQWSPFTTWQRIPVHTMLLPTGRVLYHPYNDDARLWDPGTNQTTTPLRAGYNLFCNGHSLLADGRVFMAGGHIQNGVGLPRASIYDPFNNAWSHLANMNAGRWYPTNTTLANGDVLVTSGSIDNTVGVNRLPQVWQAGSNTWRSLTNAQLSLPLYPWMHVAPNGRVFMSGNGRTTRYLDTAGAGAWTTVGDRVFGSRSYGSSVMYNPGYVIVMGGGDPPTNTAEVINLWAPTPQWRSVAPMANARRQINATIMANGQVLVTGGTSGPGFNNPNTPVFAAEIWDPWSETWTTVASNTRHRRYHSISLLLPDGRVLSAGGDNESNAEIYSPPYLFWGNRPTITSAPTKVMYQEEFFVGTPNADTISYVTLIRLGSVTHAFDFEQRIYYPFFYPVAGGLNVIAPLWNTLAPAGHYMLFLIDGNGVPSVARVIKVR